MRKIPSEIENPLDDYVLKFADTSGIIEWFYRNGFTPNMLTAIGNISRGFSIYFLVHNRSNLFLVFALIGYFFDCFDGHYARKYNMTTVFGDYFDHIGDIVYHSILSYLIFTSTKFQNLSQKMKLAIYGILAVATYLSSMHIGCQEHFWMCDEIMNNCSHSLNFCKFLCPDKDYIQWTRFFGSGTYVFIIYVITYIYA